MPDLLIQDIKESVFLQLSRIAAENGISVEELAHNILEDHLLSKSAIERDTISTSDLTKDVNSILDMAENEHVFLEAPDGKTFILMTVGEFEKLQPTDDLP